MFLVIERRFVTVRYCYLVAATLYFFISWTMSTPKQFGAIKDDKSTSWLADSFLVSKSNGVLAICKVNLIHAAIMYEYLKCPTPDQELQRCVIKIDFGPAHKAYSIIGKGKAKVEEYIGEEAISQNIKNLVVGPFWFSETENVLATFKRIENEIKEGKMVPTYSSSGSGSSGRERKFANCLTYAVNLLERYSKDLKIENFEPSKIFKALPLPNLWIRIWH